MSLVIEKVVVLVPFPLCETTKSDQSDQGDDDAYPVESVDYWGN